MQKLFHTLLIELLKMRGISLDALRFEGHILIHEPDMSEEDLRFWWPRMGKRERMRSAVCETKNILTVNGRAALLNYLANGVSTSPAWSQQFAVGNFPIIKVSPADTTVQGEFYRNNPSSVVISNNAQGTPAIIDLTTIFSGTNGNGRWFSAGLFGNGATPTTGTGQLNTHALINPSYVKSTGNIAIDYQITLN